MSNKQIIHFDTYYSSPITNSFNTVFKLPNPLHKIQQIKLKSLELPISFFNCRSNNFYFSITFTYVGSGNAIFTPTFTINIPILSQDQTITDINNLIILLNKALVTAWGGAHGANLSYWGVGNGPTYKDICTPTFQYNSSTNQIQLITFYYCASSTNIGASLYNVTLNDSYLLNTVLGYNKGNATVLQELLTGLPTYQTNTVIQTTYTFNNPFSLSNDTYINMTLSNLPAVTSTQNQKPCSFKIPLNSASNCYYFIGENTSFIQPITINNTSFIIDSLNVQITDRFGNIINPNGFDYSFSLEFE